MVICVRLTGRINLFEYEVNTETRSCLAGPITLIGKDLDPVTTSVPGKTPWERGWPRKHYAGEMQRRNNLSFRFLLEEKRIMRRPAFSNSSDLKSIVFERLRFRDGLVWTVGQTVDIKLSFHDGLVWMVGQTVNIKAAFSNFSSVV